MKKILSVILIAIALFSGSFVSPITYVHSNVVSNVYPPDLGDEEVEFYSIRPVWF